MLKAFLVGLILVMPLVSCAGSIRLLPEAHIEVTNGVPAAFVRVTNLGDEAFQLVSMSLAFQGVQTLTHFDQSLRPGDIKQYSIPFSNHLDQVGSGPAVVRIKYAHASGVACSALVLAELSGGSADNDPWISLNLPTASIGRSGKITLQLLLLDETPAEVVVKLVLPDEFSIQSEVRVIRLEPDIPRVETFEISNRQGVPGASYPIFAIIEQAHGGTAGGTGTVRSRYDTVEGAVHVGEVRWIGQSYLFCLVISLFIAGGLWALRRRPRSDDQTHLTRVDYLGSPWLDRCFLLLVSGFMVWHLAPQELLRNTTTVGGDTPAHLYLVSHLRDQLFGQGRIISWADGWWCGFPMFQYYFVLPYLIAALLSFLIPLTVVFKCVSVAGLVFTPCCAYYAARIWRLPEPCPMVMALVMVPFLFVQSHTMWGVNTASTLAGMIANSWSFALFLPALACGTRDMVEGVVRGRTIFLFVLVLASHFFTSVVMFMSLAIVPFLPWLPPPITGGEWGRGRLVLRRLLVFAAEAGVATLLMGWWLIPLVAKSAFCMDFGENWAVSLFRSFPVYSVVFFVFGAVALWVGVKRSLPALWLLVWLCSVSVILFKIGYSISPVFVNVRLWPFIFFAVMALGAVGLGLLLERARGTRIIVGFMVPVVLGAVMMGDSLSGGFTPGYTRAWATWNFSGLETKPSASVFQKMMPLLKGTSGRLANDLCEENNQLGSSRVFELVPFLTGKPILEGGLVNSALGSMYSYYIQSESSQTCAGFPPIVTPSSFDFSRATKHLELFNVKHFIARSAMTRQALATMGDWRFVARELEWELYELMTHEGRYVFVPARWPYVIETDRWKECSLQWLYTPQVLDQFMLWQMPGMKLPQVQLHTFTETQFRQILLESRNTNSLTGFARGESIERAGTQCIQDEMVEDGRIRFRTSAVGLPHIIKMTWFPNWKVSGAKQVFCISPGFMCVFPEQEEVELYYGTILSDVVGYLATAVGVGVVFAWAVWAVRRNRKSQLEL